MKTPPNICILKDLGWAVVKATLASDRPESIRISICAPPYQEEEVYAPAEGIYLTGLKAFDGLREMCEEVQSAIAAYNLANSPKK